MFKYSTFFVILVVSQLYCVSTEPVVVLFTEMFHQGNQTEIDISKCGNLPKNLQKQVTAIDTKGNCVRFFEHLDCNGNFIEVLPRSPSHHYLGDWGFNDMTVSTGPCRDQCSVNVTGPLPSKYGLNITVYDRITYKGAMESINVKGCTIVPRKMNYGILSVKTTSSEGHCFQLYNNIDCKTNWTLGQDSVELRQGTPFHDDIRRWNISPVKAISHCSFKCNTNESHVSPANVTQQPLNENEVILFDEINFRGNALKLGKGIGNCVNLDQFSGWEGATTSVNMYQKNTNCLVLYGALNCLGDLRLVLNSSLANLSTQKFDGVTRSLLFCEGNNVPGSLKQSSHSMSRLGKAFLITAVLMVGVLFLLLVVGKWWYPNLSVRNVLRGRSEMGVIRL